MCDPKAPEGQSEAARAEYDAQEVTWEYSQRDETYQPIRYQGDLDDAFVREWLGNEATDADIHALVGVPRGARVTVSAVAEKSCLAIAAVGQAKVVNREGKEVIVRYQSLVHVPLSVRSGGTAAQVLKFHYCTSEPGRTGFGTDAICRMVGVCKRIGLQTIEGLLAGDGRDEDDKSTGYYVWPAQGFDALLETWEDLATRPLPEGLQKMPDDEPVETLQDLFDVSGGPEWWRENGSTIAGIFQVDEGSPSRIQLEQAAAKLARERGRT